jgi:hypothetical protein
LPRFWYPSKFKLNILRNLSRFRFKKPQYACGVGAFFYTFYLGSAAFNGYCTSQTKLDGFCSKEYIYASSIGSAALTGMIGASLIWTGQFVYISNSGPNKGKYNSIFFTICQFTGLAGNAFNYIYYSLKSNIVLYFTIFVVIGIFGSISFFFLPDLK